MAGKPTKRPKLRTARVVEMAEFAGVSEQALRKWMTIPGFPASPDGSVCLWELAVWRHNYEHGSMDDDGPDLPDGGSPSLERWRAARASQEELKLAEMRGQLVSIDRVREASNRNAAMWRGCIEQLDRTGQESAAQVIRENLEAAERKVLDEYGLSS